MTCQECEFLLADGAAGLEEHLSACPDCRAFAAELGENAVALSSMRDEPVVEQALARNGGFSRRTRTPIWIAAAAAAAIIAAAVTLWPHKNVPLTPQVPQIAVSFPLATADETAPPVPPPKTQRRIRKTPPAPQETMLVKMLTPDPDVVIYWIVDSKEPKEVKAE